MEILSKDSLYYNFLEVIRFHYYRTHVLLEEIGVYPGQPPMLFILNQEDGLSQKELANKLKIKPSTITVMLKRMEKANLIVRKKDDKDQRVSRVYLTEKGKKVCEDTIKVVKQIERECFKDFTEEEKETLKSLFLKMKNNIIDAFEEEGKFIDDKF
ncbi:MarR family transcriptional regulator [Keratinibaculum paraultunense]|uniref:MarR family transcriptional regulator n=1 Tax=Keratinibaculum paraultunense TaxID=1278232 RepID=A0A4R3KSF4_9FIRM|nr:MarR family transcriptional regulator [Keratinibaculum paraultunense]QQY78842.1 MarR family transcriptional regulator [Keratinibaculum paraultunense]TCS87447.1 MarR family transcriptional regulator [Keratinibaculum paraultunense]